MKTTDNTTSELLDHRDELLRVNKRYLDEIVKLQASHAAACDLAEQHMNEKHEARAQRDLLQTELGNTQFALEEMAAQRDEMLAELKQILKNGSAGNEHFIRDLIAKAEGKAQS